MKLGILVDNLAASQKSFALLSNPNPATIFVKEIGPICYPSSKMISCWHDAWSFSGSIMATSLDSARFILDMPADKLYYYIWDLEWLRGGITQNYIATLMLLQNEKLNLITRSTSHSQMIENYCNRPSLVIENFEYEKLQYN